MSIKTYPSDAIGSDTARANYLDYLMRLYARFAGWGHGRVNYAIMPGILKREFKVEPNGTSKSIPLSRFDEAVRLVQIAIETTKLGAIKKSRQRLYLPFEEFAQRVAA